MRKIFLGIGLLIGLLSCDRSDDIPAYVHITAFDLITIDSQGPALIR